MTWLIEKTRFKKKKSAKIALTPNRSTDHNKNLGGENYMFCLPTFQISAQSVH